MKTTKGFGRSILDFNQFKKLGRFSGYFKQVKHYEIVGQLPKRKTKDEQDKLDKVERYCLRWGCDQIYTQNQNKLKKMCVFHPGKWDFGHTGVTIRQVMEGISKNNMLWKPHWTCCRHEWDAPGNIYIYI